jgi:serine protease AprX
VCRLTAIRALAESTFVERLNEHSLEDYLGRQRATAIYIVGGWVCHVSNNLAISVVILGQTPNAGCDECGLLIQGNEDTLTINIPTATDTSKTGVTLKITLVWTDPPGAMLQNGLDLIVKAPDGTERHGNAGLSADFDRLNNVEQVVWTNMPVGAAKITICAFKITRFPQSYAYAWRKAD